MPTLLTDPRSGGVKKKSGVNVLPIIQETWARVRDDSDETTYLLAAYEAHSKTNITLLHHGSDMDPISTIFGCNNGDDDDDDDDAITLPQDIPIFGGVKVSSNKFASFLYLGPNVGVMARGRAMMHRNGFLNVLEGCGDLTGIDVWLNMTEEHLGMDQDDCNVAYKSIVHDDNMASEKVPEVDDTEEQHEGGDGGTKHKKSSNSYDQQPSTSNWSTANVKDDRDRSSFLQYPTLSSSNTTATQTLKADENQPQEEDESTKTAELSLSTANTSSNDVSPSLSIPYEQLKQMTLSGASGASGDIDPARKEMALSDDEFHQVFGMSKEFFTSLPKWKQMRMKKDMHLF